MQDRFRDKPIDARPLPLGKVMLIWFVFDHSVDFEHVELGNKSEIGFGFVRSDFDHFGSFSLTWNVVTES